MTQPRMCLPGTTYLVTRTVDARRFLLKPDPVVNGIVLYCLFRYANRDSIQVHAISVESNHMHLVVTDPEGAVSVFMQNMDRFIACCLIAYYRETHPEHLLEGIWARGQFNATALLNQNAVIDKLLYTYTNPVKDGLVPDYRKWPGLNSRPGDWDRPERYADRPEYYFDQEEEKDRRVHYRFTVPPMLADLPLHQAVDDMEGLLRERHRSIRNTMADERRSFLGIKAVLAADPFDSPKTRRPKGKTSPTVAAGGDSNLLHQGIALIRSFRERYRQAWCHYRSGQSVTFPAGTLMMRLRHHVTCDTTDAPWCVAAAFPS